MTASECLSIITGVQSGNPQAEQSLYDRCWLLRHAKGIDPSTAEDLAHETFMRCWTAIRAGAIREPQYLTTYLGLIRLNVIRGWCRKKPTARQCVMVSDDMAVTYHTPESEAVHTERLLMAADCLSHLESEDRTIILRWCNGELVRDIAESMGLTVENTKTRKFRAQAKMRKEYGAYK